MTEISAVARAGLALFFFEVSGTSREDAACEGNQFLWRDLDAGRALKLKEQLVALLGEPDAEVLMDNAACEKLAELDNPGVIMERA